MKGKLPWPADGKIISKFGLHKNSKLNTIWEHRLKTFDMNAANLPTTRFSASIKIQSFFISLFLIKLVIVVCA